MDYSVNTRPLLESEDDTISEGEIRDDRSDICGEVEFFSSKEPQDSYKAAYLTFYLLGVLTLLPWNFFVTANDYWMYKFRDINSNHSNFNKTELQAEFTSYLSIAATGPSLFFLILNSIFSHRISNQVRMIGSLILILLSFLLTTAFVEINTDSWQLLFFAVTLGIVVLVNVFSGILQAGLWGIVSKFSTRYITAVVSGQALGGMFAAIVYIISLALGASSTHCALLYFNIANVTIIISLVSYVFLTRSLIGAWLLQIFFKYHMLSKSPANTLQYDPVELDEGVRPPTDARIYLTKILAKMWQYGFSVFMCFAVTLSVYPAVTVLITSKSGHNDWHDKYFVPVIAFLIFSIWDYVGRIVAGYFKWPTKNPWLIVTFSLIRIVFVPLILLCNAHPRHFLPVLIDEDSHYIAITCIFAFTNGYLTNITLINVPRVVDVAEQEVASSMMAVFVGFGCAAGSFLSFIMLQIL